MQNKEKFNLNTGLKKCKTTESLVGANSLVQGLFGKAVERLLAEEIKKHLECKKLENKSNSAVSKREENSFEEKNIFIPKYENIAFEPQETCNANMSSTMTSHIKEEVLPMANEWNSRPLESIYLTVFFDIIHYKVREDGIVVTKTAYTCVGITKEGKKDILGIWIGESGSAKFWLSVFSELKNRGIKDIFIVCVDELKGLPEAVKEAFPKVEIQPCIIHLIRKSVRYIPHKYLKEFINDLKSIYRAPSSKTAKDNLSKFENKWGKRYPFAINPWLKNWENVKTFFQFPTPIRRLIYTRKTVESLHRQFRRISKTRSAFQNDEVLFKLLFLAAQEITKTWTLPIHSWREIISQFAILYGERLDIN